MNSKDIFVIILLLVVLAILYKLMQSFKQQMELTTGMAKKMGVKLKTSPPIPILPKKAAVEEEEEEFEDEEDEEDEEEIEDEGEEVEVEEEDSNTGKMVVTQLAVMKTKKPKAEKKLKKYERIASVFTDTPLYSREIVERYEKEYGEIKSNDFWLGLAYAIDKKGVIKKYIVSEEPKTYIYGLPDMFDGDELKEEFKDIINN